jgi:hypothetical protein
MEGQESVSAEEMLRGPMKRSSSKLDEDRSSSGRRNLLVPPPSTSFGLWDPEKRI